MDSSTIFDYVRGFRLIRIGLAVHDLLFRDIHFLANESLKLNNATSTCLVLLFFLKRS